MEFEKTDDEVLIGLMSENPQFFQNGQLASKDQFEQSLAQQGMTLQDAVDNMRRQLILRKVQNTVLAGAIVTPKEVDDALIHNSEKAKIQYIAFPAAKFRDEVKATPEEMRQVFENNKSQYPVAEKRAFQVVVVDQAKVEKSLTISDAQLRAAYSGSMDNFRIPERVKVRHILLQTFKERRQRLQHHFISAGDPRHFKAAAVIGAVRREFQLSVAFGSTQRH